MPPHSWKTGEARVTRVLESEVPLPLTALLPEATPEALAPHAGWLASHFLNDDGTVSLAIQALVIESQGRRILVDTCIGERDTPFTQAGDPNVFLGNLAAAGFSPEGIDVVLCTHMHFDHVGWNTRKQGDRFVPTFPNARYLFARVEYEHWKAMLDAGTGGDYVSSFTEAVQPVVDAGLAELVETDHRIGDEVWLEATPGHTPGHVAVRIASGGASALITGDLTHHPVQWAEPDWKMGADSDSAQAAATRRRLLAEHVGTSLLVIGTHYPAPTAGRLVRRGDGHAFEGIDGD